jgi:protein SCO1/2
MRVRLLLAGLGPTALVILSGCQRDSGVYDAFIRADCLPAISLVDQHDHQISLSSLKGKPVLIDFIYTSCPGPCLMLTQKMARVARKLAIALGSSFAMVSITIDPEHDGSAQLAAYMKRQGIDPKGWIFLTGSPVNIERVLANFQLRRQRDADGTVEHVDGVFMLGPDGHELREYNGEVVKAETIVAELQKILGTRPTTHIASIISNRRTVEMDDTVDWVQGNISPWARFGVSACGRLDGGAVVDRVCCGV